MHSQTTRKHLRRRIYEGIQDFLEVNEVWGNGVDKGTGRGSGEEDGLMISQGKKAY